MNDLTSSEGATSHSRYEISCERVKPHLLPPTHPNLRRALEKLSYAGRVHVTGILSLEPLQSVRVRWGQLAPKESLTSVITLTERKGVQHAMVSTPSTYERVGDRSTIGSTSSSPYYSMGMHMEMNENELPRGLSGPGR
ncbi:hypothetical protein SUGI_1524420 [Cryptomeria japonica]|nr:hypothetical protein SUGI_1524420 [Cryptomeria japonica]